MNYFLYRAIFNSRDCLIWLKEKQKPILNFALNKKRVILFTISGIIITAFTLGYTLSEARDIENFSIINPDLNSSLNTIQENSVLAISNPSFISSLSLSILTEEEAEKEKIEVIITAYSSTPWETDDDPFITASGTTVKDGIVANNFLPFGTKIRIPEIYGDKIFIVEDRMHPAKGNYHIDIWFPSYYEAKNFGVKESYIEIVEG
ncbi:MAG TPA: hypothetical protein PLE40_01455 [Candidatus Pacearchaeota archaeon]|jgi:3D (Asp-Asp-Asp) domain-containing protein|nr:hypothetical protein [Candidatus Pacearchaeota archaeon]